MKLVVATIIFSLSSGLARNESWRPPELLVNKKAKVQSFEQLEKIAVQYLGRPYKMGGTGTPYFDCSGFTCRVFAEAGYAIPRVSRSQAKFGLFVPWKNIQAGDLLFYGQEPDKARINHVGLYLGNRQMIHAASGSGKVVYTNIDSNWFVQRFKTARRYIDFGKGHSQISTSTASHDHAIATDLVEHSGSDYLPVTKRLISDITSVSVGPRLTLRDTSFLGFRAATITEGGAIGLTLSPELRYVWRRLGISFALAAPIRFEWDEEPTLGEFSRWSDAARFIRTVSVGLPGAELELRLDRLGDVSAGGGFLVDRLVPGALASGVPGLSVKQTPLSFAGRFRNKFLEAQAIVSDVFEPDVFALALGARELFPGFQMGMTFASDQAAARSELTGRESTLTGLEAFSSYDVLQSRSWKLDVGLRTSALRSSGEWGGGSQIAVKTRWRSRSSVRKEVTANVTAGWSGTRFIDGIFGPIYLTSRSKHWSELSLAQNRMVVGGELKFQYENVVAAFEYSDGVTSRVSQLDQRIALVTQLSRTRIWSTKTLEARAAFVSRGLSGDDLSSFGLHVNTRLWWLPWLGYEVFLEKGEQFEGGLGVMVAWEP